MREGEQFIPITFDKTGRPFISEWRWVLLIAFLVGLLIFSAMFGIMWDEHRLVDFRGTIVFLVFMETLNLYVWTKLIRVFVIREKILKRIYSTTKKHRVTDISVFWGAYAIDDSVIYYVDGRCGILIAVERGYLFGRPPGFEELHYNRLSRFIRHLTLEGYGIKYYNRTIPDANEGPLDNIDVALMKIPVGGLKSVEKRLLKFLRALAPYIAETEREHFLVTCRGLDNLEAMKVRVSQAMDMLRGSIYNKINVCREQQIYSFLMNYFNISYIDTQNIMKSMFKKTSKKLVYVEEIIYADNDAEAIKRMIEKDNEVKGLETREREQKLRDTYIRLQQADKEMLEKEYKAKVAWVIQNRGYDLKRLSKRKYNKLAASVSVAEMQEAEKALNRIRLSKLYQHTTPVHNLEAIQLENQYHSETFKSTATEDFEIMDIDFDSIGHVDDDEKL